MLTINFIRNLLLYRAKLISLSKLEEVTSEQELAEDLMSIVTVFAARTHGKRRYNSDKKNKNKTK